MIRPRDTAPPDSQPLAFEGFDPNSGGYYNALVLGDGYGQLPPGGAPGQILVKTGRADFDAIWATAYITGDGTGGGGTGTGGDIILDSIAPIRVSGGGSAWTISIDTATTTRPGSMSAADKRRLDSLPTWRGDTPPLRALEGDLWWNTTDGTGYILYNDGTSTQWVPFTPTGGAGEGKEVYTSPAPPVGVAPETIWWNSEDGTGYILFDDGTSQQWVPLTPAGAGTKEVYTSSTPPAGVPPESIWWNSADGTGYILFDDGSSQQWVPLTPASAGTKEVYIGSTPPAGVPPESLWWDSELGRLFILYDDGSSTQWVDASPDGGGGSAKEVYSGRVPPVGVPPDTIWWSSVDGNGYLLFDDGSSQQWVPLTPQGGSENGDIDEGLYGA